jgi:2-polyprenyl-3-methyl-5-hydroxy-6-metoxy-1,4-benzoquinol methylase
LLYKKINHCRVCKNPNLIEVIDIGKQSITGDFLKSVKQELKKISLKILFCKKCYLLQLKNTTNPNILYKNYWYVSGTNKTMTNHLKQLSTILKKKIKFKKNESILDIGCNDGTFLKNFKSDLNLYGVDPARNPTSLIKNKRIKLINNFFCKKNLEKCGVKRSTFKLITSISMFYDVDDPIKFIDDIKFFLKNDGIWVVEMNYLGKMLTNQTFDMIGHEHLTYFSLLAFKNLIKNSGLFINSVTKNEINGGSIRLFISRKNYSDKTVSNLESYENKIRIKDALTYKKFNNKIKIYKKKLRSIVLKLYNKKKKIAILGASTRGNTILQFCNLNSRYFVGASDRNPMKNRLFMSGSHIQIFSENFIRKLKPDIMFVLPYFYKKELINRELLFLKQGGKFIIPLPKPSLVSYNKKIEEKLL